jgi:hypothetical protein
VIFFSFFSESSLFMFLTERYEGKKKSVNDDALSFSLSLSLSHSLFLSSKEVVEHDGWRRREEIRKCDEASFFSFSERASLYFFTSTTSTRFHQSPSKRAPKASPFQPGLLLSRPVRLQARC